MAMTNVLMAGVGGQGIIVASQALAAVALRSGLDVKKSDVHGMAQRGGSVVSHVRFGDKIYSPLIPDGEADILMASERLEALRYLPFCRKGAGLVVNTQIIPPPTVTSGQEPYPADILEKLRAFDPEMVALDCLEIAREIGNPRTATVVLLGALSTKFSFNDKIWEDAVREAVPAKAVEINLKAFIAGSDRAIASRQSRRVGS